MTKNSEETELCLDWNEYFKENDDKKEVDNRVYVLYREEAQRVVIAINRINDKLFLAHCITSVSGSLGSSSPHILFSLEREKVFEENEFKTFTFIEYKGTLGRNPYEALATYLKSFNNENHLKDSIKIKDLHLYDEIKVMGEGK